jgi:hypothetical protein
LLEIFAVLLHHPHGAVECGKRVPGRLWLIVIVRRTVDGGQVRELVPDRRWQVTLWRIETMLDAVRPCVKPAVDTLPHDGRRGSMHEWRTVDVRDHPAPLHAIEERNEPWLGPSSHRP